MENVKSAKTNLPDNPKVNRDQLLTTGDLFDFKSQMLFEIKTMLKEFTGQPTKKWLKSKEVRKLLNISPGTLQSLRSRKVIPYTSNHPAQCAKNTNNGLLVKAGGVRGALLKCIETKL